MNNIHLFQYKGKKFALNTYTGTLAQYTTEKDIKLHPLFSEDSTLDIAKEYYAALNQTPHILELDIAVTSKCNLNCPYCFAQKNLKSTESNQKNLSPRILSNLIKLIQSSKNHKGIKITWFGGEPFLAYDIISLINREYKGYIQSNVFVTNGTIPLPIQDLTKLPISYIQFTLDGPPQIHNTRRGFYNIDNFKTIVNNISTYLLNNIETVIRVNIDKSNELYH